ncbi:MAG: type II secretion system protein [bacterium]
MKKNIYNKKTGFTLLELLFVVAIIALLSSIVLSSLAVARARGRDAKRISDLRQVRNAIELYMSDNGGNPPPAGFGGTTWYGELNNAPGPGSGTYAGVYIKSLLAPKYISKVPEDPTNTLALTSGTEQDGFFYYFERGAYFATTTLVVTNDPKDYAICTKLELPVTNFPEQKSGFNLNYCLGSNK